VSEETLVPIDRETINAIEQISDSLRAMADGFRPLDTTQLAAALQEMGKAIDEATRSFGTGLDAADFRSRWDRVKAALAKIREYKASPDPSQRAAAESALSKLDAGDLEVIESWEAAHHYRGPAPGSGTYTVGNYAEHRQRVAAGEKSRTVARAIVRRLGLLPSKEMANARDLERQAKQWAKRTGG
jgi:hypothetical protein